MFEFSAPGQTRLRGTKEHERTEWCAVPYRTSDEMEQDRPGDGQRAQQKPWSEKIHAVFICWFCRGFFSASSPQLLSGW
jgi:hypothetical protein